MHFMWDVLLLPPYWGLPGDSSGKEPVCQCRCVRDVSLTPGLGRCPGAGHDNPLQYSCLVNPMDRGAWWATVHKAAKSRTRLKPLNMHTSTPPFQRQRPREVKSLPTFMGMIRNIARIRTQEAWLNSVY